MSSQVPGTIMRINPRRNNEPNTVRTISVIEVSFCRGAGTEDDIARTVFRYYAPDGRLLAEHDPCPSGKLAD